MNSIKEFQTIWEYEVRVAYLSQFLKAYGPNGDWVKLFQRCSGFLYSELSRGVDNPHIFLSIDYWQSYSSFSAMKQIIAVEYKILDELCEAYTLSEKHIGLFETVVTPSIST